MADLDKILKEIKKIHSKIDNLKSNTGKSISPSKSSGGFDQYFIKDSDAGAILLKRSSWEMEDKKPEVFSKKEIEPFEEGFGFDKGSILALEEEVKNTRAAQLSFTKEKNKIKEILEAKIEDHKQRIAELNDENNSLKTKVDSFQSTNKIIDKTLQVDFLEDLPDKVILLDLAIILNTITDANLPDIYKDEISPQTQLISTLFHISYILCELYNPNKEDSKLTFEQVNELIDAINNKINYYTLGLYPNDKNEYIDEKKHKTSTNAAYKVSSYVTLPIYLKGKETEAPAKRAVVLAS